MSIEHGDRIKLSQAKQDKTIFRAAKKDFDEKDRCVEEDQCQNNR